MAKSGPVRLAATALAAVAVALATAAPASAHSGDTLGGYGTAKVDAKLSPNEYGNSCIQNASQQAGTRTYVFTICEINDEQNDYWAIRINAKFNNPAVSIFFDNTHDGVVAPCAAYPQPVEDWISSSVLSPGEFLDSYYCYSGGFTNGFGDTGMTNGTGGCAPDSSAGAPDPVGVVCEFSHPLDSNDADDYAVKPGDTLGWCFTYNDPDNPADPLGNFAGDVQYPPGCFKSPGDHADALHGLQSHYGDVKKTSLLLVVLQQLQQRLRGLVAGCKLCPPAARATLLGELRQAAVQLSRQHGSAAVHPLKTFVKDARRLARHHRRARRSSRRLTALALSLIARIQGAPGLPPLPPRPLGGPRTTARVLSNGDRAVVHR